MTDLALEPDPESDTRQLPGDIAVWIFIFAELAVFGILFIGFAVARSLDPATFHAGREVLHPWIGLLNTAALITASYLVATAVHQFRESARACNGACGLQLRFPAFTPLAKCMNT